MQAIFHRHTRAASPLPPPPPHTTLLLLLPLLLFLSLLPSHPPSLRLPSLPFILASHASRPALIVLLRASFRAVIAAFEAKSMVSIVGARRRSWSWSWSWVEGVTSSCRRLVGRSGIGDRSSELVWLISRQNSLLLTLQLNLISERSF